MFEKESYFASYYRTKQMFIILNWSITWDLRRKIKKNYNSNNIYLTWIKKKQKKLSLTFHSALRKLYFEPSIYAPYQIAVHLTTRFQRGRFLRNRPIRNKTCLWWPCFSTNCSELSNLYRGPPIYASYQVSIHLTKRLQRRRFFRNRPIRNKNCLWQPCFWTNRTEMSNLYKDLP